MAFNKIKQLIPNALWRKVRYALIIRNHKRCKRELSSLFEQTDNELLSEIKPLKKLSDDKIIIWQYWAQGVNSSSMPDLVKICMNSVVRHAEVAGYTLLRISDENLDEYLEIPDWLKSKKRTMSKAHFADLLRCVLLSKYGGLWLDASVFLTGDIPSYILNSDFFMYRRDDSEKYKEYWQDTFAYYWGWSPNFMVKTLIGIMYAKKGNKTIADFASILLNFWKKYDTAPDYFFFQILIEAYLKKYPESVLTSISDTIPHLLRQYINENPAPNYSFSDILQKTTVHSLNYKNDVACKNLLALFPEYRKCLN